MDTHSEKPMGSQGRRPRGLASPHAPHPPYPPGETGETQEGGDACLVNFLLFLKSLKFNNSAFNLQ